MYDFSPQQAIPRVRDCPSANEWQLELRRAKSTISFSLDVGRFLFLTRKIFALVFRLPSPLPPLLGPLLSCQPRGLPFYSEISLGKESSLGGSPSLSPLFLNLSSFFLTLPRLKAQLVSQEPRFPCELPVPSLRSLGARAPLVLVPLGPPLLPCPEKPHSVPPFPSFARLRLFFRARLNLSTPKFFFSS